MSPRNWRWHGDSSPLLSGPTHHDEQTQHHWLCLPARRHSARRYWRAAIYLFNLHTLMLCGVGCLCVWLSRKYAISYNVDFTMISMGVAFPVTFAITQAFARRERALMALAELKASVVALYWHHRDWAQDQGFPYATLGNDGNAWAMEFAGVVRDFLESLSCYITATDGKESLAEVRLDAKRHHNYGLFMANTDLHDSHLRASSLPQGHSISQASPGHEHLMRCYALLSKMSVMNEYLTFKSKYARGGEGGLSRTAQYLRYCVSQLEQLRMIKIYRTPVMLRYCCVLLIHIGTVLLAPYFDFIGDCSEEWVALHPQLGCPAPYIASCMYVIMCMLLLNVQASAEHPFDMTGLDDVFVDLREEFEDILQAQPAEPVRDSGACFNTLLKAPAPTIMMSPPSDGADVLQSSHMGRSASSPQQQPG